MVVIFLLTEKPAIPAMQAPTTVVIVDWAIFYRKIQKLMAL